MSRIGEMLAPELYGGLPGFKERSTSLEAARAVAGSAENLRAEVLAAIKNAGERGLTADEAAFKLGRSVLSVRPRVSELRKAGKIAATVDRRVNHSRLLAKAWKAIP